MPLDSQAGTVQVKSKVLRVGVLQVFQHPVCFSGLSLRWVLRRRRVKLPLLAQPMEELCGGTVSGTLSSHWGLGEAWASGGGALFAEDVTGPLPHPYSPGTGAWHAVCLSRRDRGRPAGKCALQLLCVPHITSCLGGFPGWGPSWLGISCPAADACHYSWRVPSTQPSPAFL